MLSSSIAALPRTKTETKPLVKWILFFVYRDG